MSPEDALPRIVRAFQGRRSGRTFSCRCPLHDDRHASLSVGIGRSGQILIHCFAGCDPLEIIAEIKRRQLWPNLRSDPTARERLRESEDAYRRARHAEASLIWHETVPLALTPGEHYVRHWRAIGEDVRISQRFRWHWDLFALVGYISDCITDAPIGVQITPLNRRTNRREGNRQFVGQTRGGVIRLIEGPEPLVLGEGVETTLSGYEQTGAGSAWCALDSGNLAQVRVPLGVMSIGLLVDRDRAGETACRWAYRRLREADRRRRITAHWPEAPHSDWNDVARALKGVP